MPGLSARLLPNAGVSISALTLLLVVLLTVRTELRELRSQDHDMTRKKSEAPSRNILTKQVAILVSGQPRSLVMEAGDARLPQNNSEMAPMRLATGYPNMHPGGIAASIHENLYEKLDSFDVFLLTEFPETASDIDQQGKQICNMLTPRNKTNEIICKSMKERRSKVHSLQIWESMFYSDNVEHQWQFLQQLQGMFLVNSMRRVHERNRGLSYEYLIRLRPDTMFFSPLPRLQSLDFGSFAAPRIVYASKSCCCGNEDWFGIGRTIDMSLYFDRFLYVQETDWYTGDEVWTAESYLATFLSMHMNATLVPDERVQCCLVKPKNRVSPGEWKR